MHDPYLFEDVGVLRNKLGIKNEQDLKAAEADVTTAKLISVDEVVKGKKGNFSFKHLQDIHRYIFGDIYDWAGKPRDINIVKGERVLGGDTVRYSDVCSIRKDMDRAIARLNAVKWDKLGQDEKALEFSKRIAEMWQVHPFREGNTRTVITFALQYAEAYGFSLDKEMFKKHKGYVRDALVKASDGQYSEYNYLTNIVKDAMKPCNKTYQRTNKPNKFKG